MEEALQESEERFRTVAKSAPVLIWMTGPDKLCTFVNKGWLDFTGRSLEQELGIGWAEGVHPEDAAGCLEICSSSYNTRQEFRMEFRLRKGDGTYGWLLDTGVPRFGHDGTFLGYIGSCVDITERREAEAELRASQERMTMVAEAAQLGFWTWDIPRNTVWVSDKMREVFGFSATEVLTRESFALRVHPDDRAGVNQAVERALAECSRYHIEYRMVRADGAMRWMTSTGRVKADSTGAPVLVLGVAMDITERHRAEEESREVSGKLITAQEDERKRIARDLHDDLNQRLAMLSVEMEIFGSDYQGAGARELLETMATQVRELSSEVHRLSYQLHPAKLDHLGLVAAARTFCQEVATQSGIAVHFEQDEVPRDVNADVALCLYRVIQEALQNCLRHGKATAVQVMLRCDGEQIHLLVADDGKGFDVDHAMHNGGLGLVSMRERVRQVHGSIRFISSPGKGARIEATVPLLYSSARVGSLLNPSATSDS
jgi:PAS domain S-box-containing protein